MSKPNRVKLASGKFHTKRWDKDPKTNERMAAHYALLMEGIDSIDPSDRSDYIAWAHEETMALSPQYEDVYYNPSNTELAYSYVAAARIMAAAGWSDSKTEAFLKKHQNKSGYIKGSLLPTGTKSRGTHHNPGLGHGGRLGVKDKKVLTAFAKHKAAEGPKLWTDGHKLDGLWLGGTGIARWRHGKIYFSDMGSRAADYVQGQIEKLVPKNELGGYAAPIKRGTHHNPAKTSYRFIYRGPDKPTWKLLPKKDAERIMKASVKNGYAKTANGDKVAVISLLPEGYKTSDFKGQWAATLLVWDYVAGEVDGSSARGRMNLAFPEYPKSARQSRGYKAHDKAFREFFQNMPLPNPKSRRKPRKRAGITKTAGGRAGIGAGVGALALGPIGAIAGAAYGATTAKRNPSKSFKTGTLVKKTAKFLRSIGVRSGPKDGLVLGSNGPYVLVAWSDGHTAQIRVENIQKTKKQLSPEVAESLVTAERKAATSKMDRETWTADEIREIVESYPRNDEIDSQGNPCNCGPKCGCGPCRRARRNPSKSTLVDKEVARFLREVQQRELLRQGKKIRRNPSSRGVTDLMKAARLEMVRTLSKAGVAHDPAMWRLENIRLALIGASNEGATQFKNVLHDARLTMHEAGLPTPKNLGTGWGLQNKPNPLKKKKASVKRKKGSVKKAKKGVKRGKKPIKRKTRKSSR